MRTNKERTNKGQITFFIKTKWGLIRDKYLEKFSTKQNIADFLFRLAIFGKKLSLLITWCEGLGRSFSVLSVVKENRNSGPEVNRWSPDFIYSFRKLGCVFGFPDYSGCPGR